MEAPELYWVEIPGPGRLAIMPCPNGGEALQEHVESLRREGVQVLVSLLEEHEVEELEVGREAELCRQAEIEFLSHPIPDHGVPPSVESTAIFTRDLADRMAAGRAVAIHCLAGIGRSALVAGAALMTRGMALPAALEALAEARGFAVPETPDQFRWLERLAREAF